MGEGAALAMEMSDVTLMDSNLTKLRFTIKIGRKVMTTIQENIAVSIIVKIVVVALTFLGKMTLFWAITSDVGVMLVVTLNGMKILRKSEKRTVRKKTRRSSNNYDEVSSSEPNNSISEII